jgi:menaquinone-dependent protoporphyrinogen oxidase
MLNKILVTYASRCGSTAGVAEVIGATLAESGAEVDVSPMHDVIDLTPYGAVVAGSAIHEHQWLPEALAFAETHQVELNRKPFAAFLVCMTMALKNEQWRQQANVEDWLAPVRTLVRPMSEGLFAGALDISKVPSFSDRLKFRISVWSGVWSEGDHRDWDAIRAWASELALKLR